MDVECWELLHVKLPHFLGFGNHFLLNLCHEPQKHTLDKGSQYIIEKLESLKRAKTDKQPKKDSFICEFCGAE